MSIRLAAVASGLTIMLFALHEMSLLCLSVDFSLLPFSSCTLMLQIRLWPTQDNVFFNLCVNVYACMY